MVLKKREGWVLLKKTAKRHGRGERSQVTVTSSKQRGGKYSKPRCVWLRVCMVVPIIKISGSSPQDDDVYHMMMPPKDNFPPHPLRPFAARTGSSRDLASLLAHLAHWDGWVPSGAALGVFVTLAAQASQQPPAWARAVPRRGGGGAKRPPARAPCARDRAARSAHRRTHCCAQCACPRVPRHC